MITKRFALSLGMLFILLVTYACGSAAATQAPIAREEPAASAATESYAQPAVSEAPADAYPIGPVEQPSLSGTYMPQNAPNSKGREPYDMFFQDYGVNPSVATEEDHLSTFALDVDTGSYTIMRNYLSEGNLPPQDSVRVEEYVNYFEQGYPNPPAHQAFGISIDGAPSPFHELRTPPNNETERYSMLRVGIQGYDVPDSERKDVSLTFVIDVSGSMDMDNRLGLVKRSLELLVERLHHNDQVGIVVYRTEARVVLDPTPGSDKGRILRAIHSLQPEGVTNAEAGLRLGYKMAIRAYNPDGVNRVILCSDGVANLGQIEWDAILGEVRGYVEEGVMLTSIGFGMDNYNDVLMEQLADNGNGFYAYVDTMDEAERLFVDNLTGTLQNIALDAKVQVDFNPGVVSRYRLVGYENRDVADEDFRDNSVDAGEVGAGHTVTALYEVKLFPQASGRVASVYLRWQDPDTREVVELSKDFDTYQMSESFRRADPYFQWSVVVAQYAEILRDSYWAQDSSLDAVYREAQRVSEYLPRDENVSEFVELIRKARRLID
jgi:Ca-activated chloride channel family protein